MDEINVKGIVKYKKISSRLKGPLTFSFFATEGNHMCITNHNAIGGRHIIKKSCQCFSFKKMFFMFVLF